MASVTERLESLKAEIERGKTEKTRAETNLESLNKQRAEIEAELKVLGVKPEDLDREIERLKAEIEAGLAEAEGLLLRGGAPPAGTGPVRVRFLARRR